MEENLNANETPAPTPEVTPPETMPEAATEFDAAELKEVQEKMLAQLQQINERIKPEEVKADPEAYFNEMFKEVCK